MDPIKAAIQEWLDTDGDGWQITHFAVVMGLERIRDGVWENAPFLYSPQLQPDYVTDGLLVKADELQHLPVDEDTD